VGCVRIEFRRLGDGEDRSFHFIAALRVSKVHPDLEYLTRIIGAQQELRSSLEGFVGQASRHRTWLGRWKRLGKQIWPGYALFLS